MYIRWFELNVLITTKLLKNQRHIQPFTHIYQLKLIPPTGIRVESALISSSDNQPLRSLTLENDSLLFTYQISLKDGYVGLSSINLNRINDAYVITYGNSIIENEKFHLQPDATYIISNYSIPDAKSHALEFKTNPRGNVKSVKEVK